MQRCTTTIGSAAVLLLSLLGCGTVASTTETAADYQSSHGIAAHRPTSFVAAVEQLASRREALLWDDLPKDVPAALQELKDIVRWLPELAGDSDLRRADWEQVQRLVLDLQQLTESWTSVESVDTPTARSQYDTIIEKLRPLASKSVVSPLGS